METALHYIIYAAAIVLVGLLGGFLVWRKKSAIPDAARPYCWLIFVMPYAMGGFYSFLCVPVSVFLTVCLLRRLRGQKRLVTGGRLGAALALMLATAALSPLWAVDKGSALYGILRVLPLFLFAVCIRQDEDCRWDVLLRYVPESAVLMTCLGVILAQIPSCSGAVLVANRLAGFFGYPNTFALFLLVALLLCLTQRKGAARLLGVGVLTVGISMSGSRTTFVLLAVSLAVLLFRQRKNIRKGYFVAIILVALGVTVSYFVARFISGNETARLFTISLRSSTFLGRLVYAKDGLLQALRYPFGMGYGGFRAAQGSFQTAYYSVTYVHNSVLQLILDYGWFPGGMICYGILSGMCTKKNPEIVRLLLFVVLCHGLLDFDSEFLAVWFLLLPLLQSGKRKTVAIRTPAVPIAVLCCFAAASVWLGIGDMLYIVGENDMCLSVVPCYTAALEQRLTQTSDLDELEKAADKIVKLNARSAIAHSAKANAALAKGNIRDMMTEKEQAIACARYSVAEYTDYFDVLYAIMGKYQAAGDAESVEVCKNKLAEIPELLREVEESTAAIAKYLGDQPDLTLPSEYTAVIDSLR